MAASQQVLRVHVGDGAGGGNVHITAHEDGTHRRAGFQRLRLLSVAYRSRALNRDSASSSELWREPRNRILCKTVEDQRGLAWLQVVRIRLGGFSCKTWQ